VEEELQLVRRSVYDPSSMDRQRMWIGICVFAITYVLIAARRLRLVRLDRPAGALVGAVLAFAFESVTPAEAAAAVDQTTIVLLLAVMGMGAFLSIDGFFDRLARLVVARARTPARLLGALVWGVGILSAFITNDAACVLVAPLVVSWIRRWKLARLPLLLALATAANTGSVATLVGNPQNMLCGSLGGLSFAGYLGHMLPVALLALAANHAILLVVFRRELSGTLAEETAPERLFTWRSAVTLAVIFGTVALYMGGAHMAFTALGGFAVLLLVHRLDPAEVWARIDWSVLLFFGGLFIAVDGFVRSGAPAYLFAHVPVFAGPEGLGAYARTSAYFLAGSNVVTNVPFILLVKSEMAKLPDPRVGWELLAMASTFAGNLTLLGSVANIIVAEKSVEVGGLHFREYFRVGAPIAILTTILGTLCLNLVR
jgi:Na+/H+ antiporter NhaD/arsenite permease-like protein